MDPQVESIVQQTPRYMQSSVASIWCVAQWCDRGPTVSLWRPCPHRHILSTGQRLLSCCSCSHNCQCCIWECTIGIKWWDGMPLHVGGCCMAIVALSGTVIGCCDGSGGSQGYSRKAVHVRKGCIYNVQAIVDWCAVTDRIAEDVVTTGGGAADPTGCMFYVPPLQPLLCWVTWALH